jgi:cobalt-precorrin 5A hydrolase
VIAAGLGCRSGCPAADIIAAIERATAASGVSLGEVVALYSGEFKAHEASLRQVAEALHKRLVLLPRAALTAQQHAALTRSSHALARFELPSVAETAALAGALELGVQTGAARLLGARVVAGSATCALARVEEGP